MGEAFDLQRAARVLLDATAETIIDFALDAFSEDGLALSTSLSVDDMVLLDLVEKRRDGRAVHVFTLDTGRLHQETYDVLDTARSYFSLPIHVVAPQTNAIENMVTLNGPNHFRTSVAARKECCGIRKVEPLKRALQPFGAWFTGMRAAQGVTRATLSPVAFDLVAGANRSVPLVKFNPLAQWTDTEIAAYAEEHHLPVNALHAQGFPSIGCAPCTRAVAVDEDARAGRWWWEDADTKECGLHAASAPPHLAQAADPGG